RHQFHLGFWRRTWSTLLHSTFMCVVRFLLALRVERKGRAFRPLMQGVRALLSFGLGLVRPKSEVLKRPRRPYAGMAFYGFLAAIPATDKVVHLGLPFVSYCYYAARSTVIE